MIKFSCPHCKKVLKVADNLAGRKGACPGCKKLIQIPAQTVYIPSSSLSSSGSSVTDLEAMAAAALAEQKQEVVVAKEIPFTCPYCDENVKFPADLGGKQAPCPACKRIVKVPMPVKTGPRDWRKPDDQRLPSGAKRDDVDPEGAWGTEAARGVSRQALVEADVIKEERIPWSVRQWVALAVGVVLMGGLVYGSVSWFLGRSEGKIDEKALALAKKPLEDSKGDPAIKAELERLLAIYHDRAKKDPADQAARQRLMKARQAVERVADPAEQFPVIRELLATQLDLGAEHEELARVLALTPSGEVREFIVREVCRRALAEGDIDIRAARLRATITEAVPPVVRQRAGAAAPGGAGGGEQDATEQTACLAILAQELLAAGKQEFAQKLADEIRQRHKPADPFPPQLNALLIMLNKPELEAKQNEEPLVLASRAEGTARAGATAKALDTLRLPQFAVPSILRLNTLLTVADVLIRKDQKPRALELLKECPAIVDTFRDTVSWQRQALVELNVAAGDLGEAERVASALLTGPALDRARLAVLRAKLSAQGADAGLLNGFNAKSSAYHVAVFELARAKAGTDASEALKWADGLDAESAKGFAALGAAAGMKRSK